MDLTELSRARLAQVLLVLGAVALVALPWTTTAAGSSVRGYEVGAGALALIVTVATLGLVERGAQAAWMGAGFIFAALARELIQARNAPRIDASAGLWLATALSLLAVLMLIADMFFSIHEP